MAGKRRTTRALSVLLGRPSLAVVPMALLAGLYLAALALRAPRDAGLVTSQRWALSPQECTTGCQSDQTDCILDCDGNVKCEASCTEVGRACVERCRSSAADAGAP